MKRREFIKYVMVLAGGAMVPFSSLVSKAPNLSTLQMMNIRRSFLYIQKSIKRAIEGLLFEQNDEVTRSFLRSYVTDLCSQMRQRGALDRYDIDCDSDDITLNLYFKPVKANMKFIKRNYKVV